MPFNILKHVTKKVHQKNKPETLYKQKVQPTVMFFVSVSEICDVCCVSTKSDTPGSAYESV